MGPVSTLVRFLQLHGLAGAVLLGGLSAGGAGCVFDSSFQGPGAVVADGGDGGTATGDRAIARDRLVVTDRSTAPSDGPGLDRREPGPDGSPRDVPIEAPLPDGSGGDGADPDLAPDLGPPDVQPDLPPPIDPALIVWYLFDEALGSSTADATGNGRDGLLLGGAGFAAGRIGNALSLDGSDGQYLEVPDGVTSGLSDFTVATWFRLAANDQFSRIFDFGQDTTFYMFLTPRSNAGNRMRFAITRTGAGTDEEQRLEGPALSVNTWYHVAVTHQGDLGILYLDGQEVARNAAMTLGPGDLGTTDQNSIGNSQFVGDPTFSGLLDDFRFYSRSLGVAEVQALASP